MVFSIKSLPNNDGKWGSTSGYCSHDRGRQNKKQKSRGYGMKYNFAEFFQKAAVIAGIFSEFFNDFSNCFRDFLQNFNKYKKESEHDGAEKQ